MGLLHDADQGEALGAPFLLRLLVDKYERREAQHEATTFLIWQLAASPS